MSRMSLAFIACCSMLACKTTWITHPESVASPEEAFWTLRAAILSEQPKLIYDCLSPEYRKRLGMEGQGTFKVGYGARKDEFDDIAWALERAEPKDVVHESGPDGTRRARLTIDVLGQTATLVMVEVPTVTLSLAFPGYDPERLSYYRRWKTGVSARDGRVTASHPVDPALGIEDATDIEELRFYSRWLIDDVLLPGQ